MSGSRRARWRDADDSPRGASRRRLAGLALVAALSLVGCAASVPPPGVDAELLAARVAVRDAELRAFERFRVRGGLGVWNEETSLTARIDWRQTGTALDLALRGPFGFGSARLTDDSDGATFRRGDAAPLTGASAGALLQRALGLTAPVPIEQLALWLRGLPGEADEVSRDVAGRLETLRWVDASGTRWRARVRGYTTLGALELPSLLTARGGGQNIRLALRDWSFGPAPDAGTEGEPGAGGGEGAASSVIGPSSTTPVPPLPPDPRAPRRLPPADTLTPRSGLARGKAERYTRGSVPHGRVRSPVHAIQKESR